MKNFVIIFLSLVVLALASLYLLDKRNVAEAPENGSENVATTTEQETQISITQVTDTQITLSNGTVISINDFPDEIQVSEEAAFGSSDKIKGAKISANGTHVAIAIAGAAHDFGWIYEVATADLTPVIFSYGGNVEVGDWQTTSEVAFLVTTPEPAEIEKVVNVNALPEYPL